MGVLGLLPILKEIQEPTSLERYRGKTLAIDTYGWLHRALVSCSQELCQDKPTKKYITYVMNKVQMLQHFGITPYFVFDGGILPTKLETLKGRREKREESMIKANEYIRTNNSKLAYKEFMKAASVTPQMAKSVMNELDKLGIKYIVAPYEADPQMVYMEKEGLVDGILSEDSDLLIFGCNRLITKLKADGTCIEVCRQNFHKAKQVPYISTLSEEQLRLVVMLSGCDYTKGIPGIGIKKSFTLVKTFQSLDNVLVNLKSDSLPEIDSFKDELSRADLAFRFQKVYNPRTHKMTTLNEYPVGLSVDFELVEICCGLTIEDEIIRKVCTGLAHPTSHSPLLSREEELFSSRFKKAPLNKAIVPQRSNSTSAINKGRTIFDYMNTKKVTIPPLNEVTALQMNKHDVEKKAATLKRNLSPTTKKIKNINSLDTRIGSPIHSKFFKNALKQKSLPATSSFETQIVENPVIVDDGGITDNDDFFSEDEELDSIIKTTSVRDFEVNEDDEIEESPVKKRTALASFVALRENFLYKETERVVIADLSEDVDDSLILEEQNDSKDNSRAFVFEDSQILGDSQISDDDHVTTMSPPKTKLTPANLGLTLKISRTCASESQASIEDEFISEDEVKTTSINLRKFAFRG